MTTELQERLWRDRVARDIAIARNIAAFKRMRLELEALHNGRFVVFHDGQFINSFDTLANAARAAVARFRGAPYLIRQVAAPVGVARARTWLDRRDSDSRRRATFQLSLEAAIVVLAILVLFGAAHL